MVGVLGSSGRICHFNILRRSSQSWQRWIPGTGYPMSPSILGKVLRPVRCTLSTGVSRIKDIEGMPGVWARPCVSPVMWARRAARGQGKRYYFLTNSSWAPYPHIISNIKSSGSLILLGYHTLYQWPVWGCGLCHGRTSPARPEEGGGGRQSLCSACAGEESRLRYQWSTPCYRYAR